MRTVDMLCTSIQNLRFGSEREAPLCTCRGAQVESHFRLTEDTIECYDYNEKDGEHIFGGAKPVLLREKSVT